MSDVREVLNVIVKHRLLEEAGLLEEDAHLIYDDEGRIVAVVALAELDHQLEQELATLMR